MTFEPGTYYVGDICYAFNHDSWDEVVKKVIALKEGGSFEYKGKTIWFHSTAYGDGLFVGSDSCEYGVDSGTIGVIPIEVADKEKLKGLSLGRVLNFSDAFTAEYKDGVFTIGDITINTGG